MYIYVFGCFSSNKNEQKKSVKNKKKNEAAGMGFYPNLVTIQ